MIYFDNAATTAIRPSVWAAISETALHNWGNPSSLHSQGYAAKKTLEETRKKLADLLGADPQQVVFTASATEANNLAFLAQASPERPLAMSTIEHASIIEQGRAFRARGGQCLLAPVNDQGQLCLEELAGLLQKKPGLLAIMAVNNELGSRQPLAQVQELIEKYSPQTKLLVDGVQAVGKEPFHFKKSGFDYLSFSGHKLGAPKGVGALLVKEPQAMKALIHGGQQEGGLRAGTENLAYAVGLAQALEESLADDWSEVKRLRAYLVNFFSQMEGCRINSPKEAALHILNLGFTGIKAEVLLRMLEADDIYISSGSACAGGRRSHVLEAIALPEEYLDGSIRLSFSAENTLAEAEEFAPILLDHVATIRSLTA